MRREVGRLLERPERRSAYLCPTGAHGVIEARKDDALRSILNRDDFTVLDGMSVVYAARTLGFSGSERAFGPDIMWAILEDSLDAGVRHFFDGGSEGVAPSLEASLRRRLPGASAHPPALRLEGRVRGPETTMTGLFQSVIRRLKLLKRKATFPGSEEYWEARYAQGGTSGVGSEGDFARFKAEVLNNFVATHRVRSVIEFGCGDGKQLTLAKYPRYLGLDVSPTAVRACTERFAGDDSRTFLLVQDYRQEPADLALSLDVIYHLVEDEAFHRYMTALFDASTRYVIIYSSNSDDNTSNDSVHVRHRQFTRWVDTHRASWRQLDRIPNRFRYEGDYRTGSFAEFFIYELE